MRESTVQPLKITADTICVVTCYKQPDYVRAVTLAEGLKASGVFTKVIEVRNRSTGLKRYMEVVGQLLKVRFTQNPDAYLITFRGYEILPLVLLVALGKKVIYDEMINPVEWFVYEHKKFNARSFRAYLLRAIFRFLGKHSAAILMDTSSHAAYSAKLMDLPLSRYRSIPVSTDETRFYPEPTRKKKGAFTILYCGNMLPLYGVDHVLRAAAMLKKRQDIEFHIVGGKEEVARKVEEAKKKGAHIIYQSWVPYKDFPELFHASDLCLGGPFGKTVQSNFVITGKTYQFLAAGLPVVIGDNKEAYEFTHMHDALIVPEANATRIKEMIEWAAGHPKELRRIARNGRKLYEKKFSSKRVAEELRTLFSKKRIVEMED